ncbi:MAG: hypothetical protein GX594_08090, partial [Pirellulaceae bacterium]|nr:hypothetical protein [Pirellulaceae bacterium]
MKHDSTPTDAVKEEVFLLAVQAFCGDLSDAEARRFEQLILSDPKARRLYVEFICDVGNLRLLMNRYDSVGGVEAAMLGGGGIGLGGIGGAAIVPSADLPGLGFSPAADYATEDAFASDRFGALGKGAGIAAATSQSSPRPAMPSEPERHSALFVADDPPSYSRLSLIPLDSHLGGWLFSYSVAAVFLCLLLLGFWAYKLPSDRGSSIARNENSRGLTAPGELSPARPAPVFVGHITGIAGAKWSDDPDYLPPIGVRVALGRKYKLKSGLLEITYDSGARVILEGPCSYEVDSTAGGYLSLGKLTARIEDRGEGIGGSGMKADSLATRHQPLATDPSPLSSLPSPLFTVRTPT